VIPPKHLNDSAKTHIGLTVATKHPEFARFKPRRAIFSRRTRNWPPTKKQALTEHLFSSGESYTLAPP